jgi:hypothetical protein
VLASRRVWPTGRYHDHRLKSITPRFRPLEQMMISDISRSAAT